MVRAAGRAVSRTTQGAAVISSEVADWFAASADEVQVPPPEEVWAEELAFLEAWDTGDRPPGWRLTPRAVVVFDRS